MSSSTQICAIVVCWRSTYLNFNAPWWGLGFGSGCSGMSSKIDCSAMGILLLSAKYSEYQRTLFLRAGNFSQLLMVGARIGVARNGHFPDSSRRLPHFHFVQP